MRPSDANFRQRVARLALAFLLPPVIAGLMSIGIRLHGVGGRLDAAPAPSIAMPGPRPPTASRALAVLVAGNHGTEITDSLPIIELLEASGAFEVRVVAPERRGSPFATSSPGDAGLDFVPDLSFAEYDRLVARSPALVVVPYLPRWRVEDRAVTGWLRGHVGPDTTVLSICQGAEIVAEAGLFDGHEATANARQLAALATRYPAIHWQSNVRWVRDGRRISSALLAAGMDATVAAIDALAGRAAAARAIEVTGYPAPRGSDDRSQPPSRVPLRLILDIAYRWRRTTVVIQLDDGVAESAVAGLVDGYAVTYTTDVLTVAAPRRIVRSRYGLALMPRASTGFGRHDVLVAAAAALPGIYGYDFALETVERSHGGAAARAAAELLDYSPAQPIPAGKTRVMRP